MRVAAIDQGTNTTRLLVADVDDGRVEDVVARQEITRLGEGVDFSSPAAPAPDRARSERAHGLPAGGGAPRRGTDALVATSAVRDAENGEAFLGEVEWSYGFTTQLLAGEDEAELTFRGVTSDRQLERPTLVLDIGGGSTEPRRRGPTVCARGTASTWAPSG